MNLHEYQAKTLLKNNNVRVLAGIPVLEVAEIDNAIDSIQTPVMVVKSQIHAGGRGAGKFLDSGDDKGGVRVCFSKEDPQLTSLPVHQGQRANDLLFSTGKMYSGLSLHRFGQPTNPRASVFRDASVPGPPGAWKPHI